MHKKVSDSLKKNQPGTKIFIILVKDKDFPNHTNTVCDG